jgi:tRNA dimethylallyltransferase
VARAMGRTDKSPTSSPSMKIGVEVVAVFGPTAAGKSVVADALAGRLGTEVVSADALQVYRGLAILTNQPQHPTRLVGIRELADEMSVAAFASLAHDAIDELVVRRGSAVVAGGTGLYLRAALADLGVPPKPAPASRARWEAAYDSDPDAAYRTLASRDAAAAARVHRNDRRRVVRALELAEIHESLARDQDGLWGGETRRPTLVVGLDVPEDVLVARIERRTAEMFRLGVVDEVRCALARPLSRTAAKALGLHDIASLEPEAARERIVTKTRRYAAYQRKWMRRIPGIVMIDADRSPVEVADAILEVARAR